jgi:tetratricopeptide (TPR) repeat protein
MAESHREEIAKLESLYASNPGGRVFVHLAEALRKAGELERARSILTEGLARHTDSASGFVVLGRVLADLGSADEAEAAFRQVLGLDGGNLVALRGLGDIARLRGRYAEAVEHYRELLSRSPSNDEVQSLLETMDAELAAAEQPPADQAASTDAGSDDGAADSLDDAIAPYSAAPGESGPAMAADPDFGIVEIDALPGDLASVAGMEADSGSGSTGNDAFDIDWAELENAGRPAPDEGDLARAGGGDYANGAAIELPDASGTDMLEAEPLELQTLDVAAGAFELEDEVFEAGAFELEDDALEIEAEAVDAGDESVEDGTGEVEAGTFEAEGGTFEAEAGTFEAEGGTFEAEDGTFEAEAGTFEAEDGTFEVEDGTFEVEDGTFEVDDGTFEVEDGTFEAEDGTFEAEDGALAIEAEAVDAENESLEAAAGAQHSLGDAEVEAFEPGPVEGEAEAEAEVREAESVEAGASEDGGGAVAESLEAVDVGGFGGALGGPPVPEDEGLQTETMADLYRSQGFHDRAAQVYRVLLQQKPDDERLAAKLRDAEQSGNAAVTGQVESLIEEDEAGEVWLRGSAWTGHPADSAPAETPYAWTAGAEEAGSDAPQAAPIGTYLRGLVSWRPSAEGVETAGPELTTAADPSAGLVAPAGEAGAEELRLDTAVGAPGEPAAAEPGSEPAAEPAPWDPSSAPAPWDGPAAPSTGSDTAPWGSSSEAEPWSAAPAENAAAEAAPAEAAPAEAEAPPWQPPARRTSRQVDPVEDAFDAWYSESGSAGTGTAEAQPSPETERVAEPVEALAPDPVVDTPAPGAPASPTGEVEGGDDDEDLAMFRTWLQSLKK